MVFGTLKTDIGCIRLVQIIDLNVPTYTLKYTIYIYFIKYILTYTYTKYLPNSSASTKYIVYVYFVFSPVLLIVQYNNYTIIILSQCSPNVRSNYTIIEIKIRKLSLFADAYTIWPRKYITVFGFVIHSQLTRGTA